MDVVKAHGCGGAGGASARHAEKVGIYIDEWTLDPQHRPARPAGSIRRICHRPRISPSPRPKSRESVQEFHVRLPARLGGTAAPPPNLAGRLTRIVARKRKAALPTSQKSAVFY